MSVYGSSVRDLWKLPGIRVKRPCLLPPRSPPTIHSLTFLSPQQTAPPAYQLISHSLIARTVDYHHRGCTGDRYVSRVEARFICTRQLDSTLYHHHIQDSLPTVLPFLYTQGPIYKHSVIADTPYSPHTISSYARGKPDLQGMSHTAMDSLSLITPQRPRIVVFQYMKCMYSTCAQR